MDQAELYDLLVEARRVQADRGHAKNLVLDSEGRVCMEGAILFALAYSPEDPRSPAPLSSEELVTTASFVHGREWFDIEWEASQALGFEGGVGEMCAWNNEIWRTLDEVLERFDEAILRIAPVPDPIPEPVPEPVSEPLLV